MNLKMEKIANVRDLGGLVMQDGRAIKPGLLLRGAKLRDATPNDIERLHDDFHVRIIFDFRTEKEVMSAPDPAIPGAEYLWLPTLDPFSGEKGKDVFSKYGFHSAESLVLNGAFFPDVQQAARTLYTDLVDNEYSQLQHAVFLQRLLSLREGAAFWHCTQGKDRTGMGAMFILGALGASRETILDDYLVSNESYAAEIQDMSEKILEMGGGEAELEVVRTFIGVNVKYFIDGLDLIESRYGGMDSYLRDVLLLSDSDKDILRERYLGRSQGTGF